MSDEQQAQPEQVQSAPVQPQPEQPEAIPAVGFLVMAFRDQNSADQVLDTLKQAKKQDQFYFEDAAVIRQDANGKVHYHETGDMSTGKGAGIGALVGGVIGLLGGPAGVLLGAGAGAAIGGAFAHGDAGFKNESLETVGTALQPGNSALAVITSRDFLKAVQQAVPAEDLHKAVGNLAEVIATQIAAGNDVAVGILLTEAGLAVKAISANADSAQVVGAVITDDAIVAGRVVVTPEGVAYKVGAATAEGATMEAGVVTDEGAAIVDAVAVPEDAPAADAASAAEAATKPAAEATAAAAAATPADSAPKA